MAGGNRGISSSTCFASLPGPLRRAAGRLGALAGTRFAAKTVCRSSIGGPAPSAEPAVSPAPPHASGAPPPISRSSSVAASRCLLSVLAASRTAQARASFGGSDASRVSAPRRISVAARVSSASIAGASDGARLVLLSAAMTMLRTSELRSLSRPITTGRNLAVSPRSRTSSGSHLPLPVIRFATLALP